MLSLELEVASAAQAAELNKDGGEQIIQVTTSNNENDKVGMTIEQQNQFIINNMVHLLEDVKQMKNQINVLLEIQIKQSEQQKEMFADYLKFKQKMSLEVENFRKQLGIELDD